MDEAELSCAMNVDRGALQDELQGAGGADDARQPLSATPAWDHAGQDLDLLRAEAVHVIVSTTYADQPRSVDRCPNDLAELEIVRDEDPGLETGPSRLGRDGVGEVPGRGAPHGLETESEGGVDDLPQRQSLRDTEFGARRVRQRFELVRVDVAQEAPGDVAGDDDRAHRSVVFDSAGQ